MQEYFLYSVFFLRAAFLSTLNMFTSLHAI